jgi:hypothetical protein
MRKRLSECSRRPPQLALTAIVVGERFCFVGGSARVPISKQRTRSSSFPIAEPRSHATIALSPTRLSMRDDRQKAAPERLALLPPIGPHRFVTATASSA